jgi:PhnB protein
MSMNMTLNPYLFFEGNCEEAFKFYEKLLGGKIVAMMPHEGTPAETSVPPEWRKKIIHACMNVAGTMLMASDAPPPHSQKPQGFYVNIGVTTAEEAERIFKALEQGGKVTMAMAETFWAVRFGMVVDRFGTPWMVNCAKPG